MIPNKLKCVDVLVGSAAYAGSKSVLAARLRAVPGVMAASINGKQARIWYRGNLSVDKVYMAVGAKKGWMSHPEHEPGMAEYRRDAIVSLAGFAAMQLMRRFAPDMFEEMKLLRSAVVFLMARNFIKNGVQGLIKDRSPNADTLTSTAVIASLIAGKPESSMTLLTLSNVAEMLTSYAAERARKQISGLLNLNQSYVWLIDNGVERKVAVESLKAGDMIAAHAGEKICVDGKVISGTAAVNQSSITGESKPDMKHEKSPVYAGSVIEAGEIEILVEKVGADTSLAHIVHLVEEAQARRAPVQNFADQMANLLVPISFIGAGIVYGATRDWQRVLNLLFIDFSCGLKLSTATAISASIAA